MVGQISTGQVSDGPGAVSDMLTVQLILNHSLTNMSVILYNVVLIILHYVDAK